MIQYNTIEIPGVMLSVFHTRDSLSKACIAQLTAYKWDIMTTSESENEDDNPLTSFEFIDHEIALFDILYEIISEYGDFQIMLEKLPKITRQIKTFLLKNVRLKKSNFHQRIEKRYESRNLRPKTLAKSKKIYLKNKHEICCQLLSKTFAQNIRCFAAFRDNIENIHIIKNLKDNNTIRYLRYFPHIIKYFVENFGLECTEKPPSLKDLTSSEHIAELNNIIRR
jgi:hypothetical protein